VNCTLTFGRLTANDNVKRFPFSVQRSTISETSIALPGDSQASPAGPSDSTSMQIKMNTEHWWKDAGRVQPKYREKNLSQRRFDPRKSHIRSPRIEPRTPHSPTASADRRNLNYTYSLETLQRTHCTSLTKTSL
jgi:hypothetical protein